MTTYTFVGSASSQFVAWDDPSVWSGGVVPNGPDADVVFPTITMPTGGSIYHSTAVISPGEAFATRSVEVTNNTLYLGAATITSPGSGNAPLSTGQLTIGTGGEVSGVAQIAGPVVNNGELIAGYETGGLQDFSPPTLGTLDIGGPVTGTGSLVVGQGYTYGEVGKGGSYPTTYVRFPILELGGSDSENVTFLDVAGALVLDDPQQFTGVITPASAESYENEHYAFGSSGYEANTASPTDVVNLPNTPFSSVTGYSYAGDASGGTLTIQEGTVSQVLKFSGDFNAASFTLSAGPQASSTASPSLNIAVAPLATVISDTAVPAMGDFGAEKTLAFDLTTNVPVTATGTPVLTLNDGGTAALGGILNGTTLYFETTIQPGQDATTLAVTGVALPDGATLQALDSMNPVNLSGAAATFAGLSVDGTAPTAPSASLLVAPGQGATPIGLAAPSDNQTAAAQLAITVTALPTDGTVTLADGTTPVSAGEALTAGQLAGLEFTPTFAADDVTSALGYSVADLAGNTSAGTATLTVAAEGSVLLPGDHGQYTIYPTGDGTNGVAIGPASTQALSSPTNLAFTDSAGVFDATGNAGEVARLFQVAFNRPSDLSGLDYWTGQLDSGALGLAGVAQGFVDSTEFQLHYGTVGDRGFIAQLYQNVLGRPGDAGGEQFWLGQLTAGESRAQVLLGFSDSQENKANTAATIGDKDTAEAYRLYQAAFNRTPDASGLSYWTQQLDQGATPLGAAQGFVSSTEFMQDFAADTDPTSFVTQLYSNVLHRVPDAAGEQYWVGQIEGGASQAQVLLGFADSTENRAATANATHDGSVFLGHA